MAIIKAGIVGCGCIFPMHAYPVYNNKDVLLVAICDIDYEKAHKAANEFNCKAYSDFDKMLDESDLDVVHILTPHYLHPIMAIKALNKKINVLTEKPMSIDYTAAKNMLKAAKENDKTLGVIFQNRYNKGSILIKDTLESGKLGKIISAKLSVTWKRDDLYYSSSNWKGTWDKEGGGVLINQAIHTFDLARWFVDSDVEYVDAYLANRFHKDIEVEDCAEGIIKFENGVIASFHSINYYGYDAPVSLELYCENGIANMTADVATITFNDGSVLNAMPDKDDDFEYGEEVKSYWGANHYKQIKQFYNSLKNGGLLDIQASDALKTQKLICDIYESGKQKWNKINNKI